MDAVTGYLHKQQNNMVAMLRRFVESESPSTEKSAVEKFGRLVAGVAQGLGGRVRFYQSQRTGNHLLADFRFDSSRHSGQILLLGHLDTVWELGTIRRMPFRIKQNRAYGPGAFDMKSGIVSGLFALKALQHLGVPIKKRVVFLLTGDEEIGSPSSRPVTERWAVHSDFVLVLEPAFGLKGALKTARKGVGDFEVRVRGRSAHAGLEPEKGASAISELCRQILRLERFADGRKGITVNVGIIAGGDRSNVVPSEAAAKVDVRIGRLQNMKEMERKFRSLRPYDPRTALTITGGFNRPPMERTVQVAELFARARRLASSLGFRLTETSVGGASDGNFAAALGIPTLDGLGGVGEGAHAAHENVIIPELPRRSALLAHLIRDLVNGPM